MRLPVVPLIALCAAIILTNIGNASAHLNATTKFTSQCYWYIFTGNQTCTDRENCNNYCCPTLTEPAECSSGPNECAVRAKVVLDIHGNPPAHPDCSCLTFDATTCMPNGGTCFCENATKP